MFETREFHDRFFQTEESNDAARAALYSRRRYSRSRKLLPWKEKGGPDRKLMGGFPIGILLLQIVQSVSHDWYDYRYDENWLF